MLKNKHTADQTSALKRFAEKHGRTWKSKLKSAWANGTDSTMEDGALLRQVRNDLGPVWLTKFDLDAKMPKLFVCVCMRCNGTGRYDRGACFGCRPFGSTGWVSKPKRATPVVQVTAIRSAEEGRIDWIKVYGGSPGTALGIVQREMRVKGLPQALQDSVQAAYATEVK